MLSINMNNRCSTIVQRLQYWKRQVYFEQSVKDNGFCWATRWLRRAYFLFGMMPISVSPKGRMQFKFYSWSMFYSVVIYTILTIYCNKVIFITLVYKLTTLLDDFDRFIYNFMFLSFVKTQYFYSIGGWLAAKHIAIYHNMWIDFESSYLKHLKRTLLIKPLEYRSNIVVIICMLGGITLILVQCLLLQYSLLQCTGYIPSMTGWTLYFSLMYINCTAIEMASDQLLGRLTMDLQANPVTQDVIRMYKELWVYLSNLTQYNGVAFFYYSVIMLLGSFIDLAASGYGYLSRLLAKFKSPEELFMSKEEYGLIIATIASAYFFVYVSNITHFATKKVERCYIDTLCLAATNPHHPKVIIEIDRFLHTIKTNPPIISLRGYANLDRKLITKVFTTIVTYWVVLLQFKVGFKQTTTSSPP